MQALTELASNTMAHSRRPSVTWTHSTPGPKRSTPDPGILTDRLNEERQRQGDLLTPPTPRDPYASNVNDLAGQTTPDPDGKTTPPRGSTWMPTRSKWRMYWSQEVAKDKVLEAQMMIMTVITGIVDAATYTKFKVFATKQTGECHQA